MNHEDDVVDDDEGELVPLGAALERVDAARAEAELRLAEQLTDSSNAERWVELHGERFRWHPGRERWMVWSGSRWALDDAGEALRTTKDVAASWMLRDAVVKAKSAAELRGFELHAKRSGSASARVAMLRLAQAEQGMSVATDQWDADPWLLNVANGVLDLRTGRLQAHRPGEYQTKLAPVAYDPDARAPVFERFLEQALPANDVRAFVARSLGYALTGVVREHVLPVWYGAGGNGKGTLQNAVSGVLGDYAKAVPADLMMRRTGGDQHPTERAMLMGLRLAFASETEAGRQLAESTVKSLTGGDPITARFMRQDFFTFLPSHKLILSTNHRPIIRGNDAGIWRRVRLVPWETTPRTIDTTLGEQLAREGPGILRWLVEGCLAWQRDGLGSAASIDEATRAYRHEQDVCSAFLEECTTRTADAKTSSAELYAAYRAWCAEGGERNWTQRAFVAALQERGLDRVKAHGTMTYRGLGLLADRPGASAADRELGRRYGREAAAADD